MKKFIASAGLLTVGAVGLNAAYAPGLSPMETSKPWSVSAALRGFYDDNYNAAPSHPSNPAIAEKKSSAGFEVSPSIRFNFPMEQTYLGASYLYSLKYYDARPGNKVDHLHDLELKADHRFSERYKLNFDDSFVYSVEPTVIDSSGAVTAPDLRANADAIRNRAMLAFSAQMTELLGLEVSYQNTYYDYLKSGANSFQAALDRDENLFDIHGTYHIQEHLVGLFGYQFELDDYTSSQLLNPNDPASLAGSDRSDKSHYFYLGLEHAFSSQLNGSIRVGAQYMSWDHLSGSEWNPYVDLRGTYTYLPGSYVQLAFTHTRNATDVVGAGEATDIVKDQESSTVSASINHRITPKLTGGVQGSFQNSTYAGGSLIDGKVDRFFLVGVNLDYRFNPNWAVELGYNFDRLDSELPDRSFSRNRVYAGVRASF